MDILKVLVWSCGLTIFFFGLQSLFFLPLTVWYEIWKRRFFARFVGGSTPFVSVVVPAYNEERTIAEALRTMISSEYPAFEIIVVNDGSTDGTGDAVRPFLRDPHITCLAKPNGGKASALNAAIAVARGEVIFFTDADTLFQKDTIGKMARWFADPEIDAVCGDDTPLRPETPLQKLLTITTHIGTGFVRRAFSMLSIMPIISGNCGAVRKNVLEELGGFEEGWGEDLALTFALQRKRARIVYDWEALVHCEAPATFRALWKQRVRWIRSYLKISRRHRDMFFNLARAPFSLYAPINWFNLICIPVLQLILILTLPGALRAGLPEMPGIVSLLAFLGYFFFFAIAAYSILLDRKPAHLRYLPLYGWLIIPFSFLLNAAVVYSLYEEYRRSSEVWSKYERRSLSGITSSRQGVRRFVYPAVVVSGLVAVLVFSALSLRESLIARFTHSPHVSVASLTLATHFDAWDNADDAMTSIFNREQSGIAGTIAVGAGRYEWNYFRWNGHEDTWSNHQHGARFDMLGSAISTARRNGRKVVAIVDFYAPKYISAHPDIAAVGSNGARSDEEVCFTELTRGEYGRGLKEMITYLAKNYDVEAISLTELDYRRYCYDDRCLASFTSATGDRSWPKTLFGGDINKENHTLGAWRSNQMASFLNEIADSTHRYGKKLYIDVPVDYERMNEEGIYNGLYYPKLLRFADAIIVWDYFYLEGREPSSSEDIAKFFVTRYDPEKIIFSPGLWGSNSVVSPDELSTALSHELLGGARKIWVTPNHLVSDEHWKRMVSLLRLN